MMEFTCRIRDLVHSFIYITECEEGVINHPLFQRLRFVAHNDVSSYVYPSLNTTRFEHSLGTVYTAGKIVKSISKSEKYEEYLQACGLEPDKFEQIVRLYALLHDLGHPPLSHLFESAFSDFNFKKSPKKDPKVAVNEWTGNKGFHELHESLSFNFANIILNDLSREADIKDVVLDIKDVVLDLMKRKKIKDDDPLNIIKKIVDSDIDADRIDSVARDGMLGGGEYGNYDIERLTSSPRVIEDDGCWKLAFNHKVISALESLLFERYRTYTWIHHHHRIRAFNTAARIVISKLLEKNVITKEDFSVKNEWVKFHDDYWLWSLIRESCFKDNIYKIAKNAILSRRKSQITPLWKNRCEYSYHIDKLNKKMDVLLQNRNKHNLLKNQGQGLFNIYLDELRSNKYEESITEKLGFFTKVDVIPFSPISPIGEEGEGEILLCDEKGKPLLISLYESSAIVRHLNKIWEFETRFYVLFFGDITKSIKQLGNEWIEFTAEHLTANI